MKNATFDQIPEEKRNHLETQGTSYQATCCEHTEYHLTNLHSCYNLRPHSQLVKPFTLTKRSSPIDNILHLAPRKSNQNRSQPCRVTRLAYIPMLQGMTLPLYRRHAFCILIARYFHEHTGAGIWVWPKVALIAKTISKAATIYTTQRAVLLYKNARNNVSPKQLFH
jgi:hypothetical protein